MGVWASGPREDRAAGEEGLRAGTGDLDTDMPQTGMCGRRDFPASYPLPVPLSGMGEAGNGRELLVTQVVLPVLSGTSPLGDLLQLRVSLHGDNSKLMATLDLSPCSRLIRQRTRPAFV